MKLEELRYNDLGVLSVWLPALGNGPQSFARLTFPQHVNNAFYLSAQQIEQLEQSKTLIVQGNAIPNSVGLWFISVEAYINSILRISCLLSNVSFDEYKSKDLGARITALFELLGTDRKPFYQGAFQRLDEFKRYRNELFHDRTNDSLLVFQKTSFSGNPMYANQVDVMQAAVVALEVFEAFRHAIPKLDLMPQIHIKKNDSFFYFPLDQLYSRVLRPYFEMALTKHSLSSDINLNIDSPRLATSPLLDGSEIQVLVKAIPEEKFSHPASQQNTKFGDELWKGIRDGVDFDTNQYFQIPSYQR